MAVSQIDLKMT